jgi:hypothetical protein
MDAAFLQAAHPEPFTILATRLEPFSLGHEILFQRFGNKFSVESAEAPGIKDALTGVFICSQPYRRDVSLDGFRVPLRARIWSKVRARYLEEVLAMFHAYIAAHSEVPDFYTKRDDSGEPVGTPTVQAVKISLMANLGMTEDKALNTPFSLAFWNHLSWLEGQGVIQIVDDAEKKRQAERAALAAAMEEKVMALKARLFAPKEEVSLGA